MKLLFQTMKSFNMWDTLKLSNMKLRKEKGELENKIAEIEAQKYTAD